THVLSFLGCTEQYQFCVDDAKGKGIGRCLKVDGLYAFNATNDTNQQTVSPLALSPNQKAVDTLLWTALWTVQLNFQLGFVGRENLDEGFDFGIFAPLPSNQWQIEVQNWMNTSLAAIQRSALRFAQPNKVSLGQGTSTLRYADAPRGPEMRLLCEKVKSRSVAHTPFPVRGLGLTLGLGAVIILTNLMLPGVVARWQKRTGKGEYKRLEWVDGSAFQLRRMAAEGRGVGPWEGKENDVPHLVESRHVFSLTGESLKVGGYEIVRKGARAELEEIELGTIRGVGGGEREGGEGRNVEEQDDRIRLLYS
ncbi:uncharacterized protein BDR25DRAFT_384635, partial [Lindgomyces ingoldianus]